MFPLLLVPPFPLSGEDEAAGASGFRGGDCAIWSVLYCPTGETHLSQLGQGDSRHRPRLSHVQGTTLYPAYRMFIISNSACLVTSHPLCRVQGRVCGLCGNFDGNVNNDLMSSNNQLEVDSSHFGNSWKVIPSCADATQVKHCLTLKGPVHPHLQSTT